MIIKARKLWPYFQAHPVTILINMPLRSVFSKLDLSRRMMMYAIDLSAYGVQFCLWKVKKAQVIANFIAKYVGPQEDRDLSEGPEWVLHMDGSPI